MSHVMNTYARQPVAFVRGEGVWLWDEAGKKYLDALAGIAVNTLGYAHPRFTSVLQKRIQSGVLHTSNLWRIPDQEAAADRIAEITGLDEVFFCNSGLEANEAAIKIARKYGHDKGIDSPEIIVCERAFHGRSLATLSATGNPKIQAGFGPLVEGFVRVPFNDAAAVRAVAQSRRNVVAVMLEPVQGEGGINPARNDYLRELRALCDENGWLLMLDEVQCGIARTGKWFAFQWSGIQPDVMSLAKGLGSGVPVGALVVGPRAKDVFGPGNHGSTFGGNPLAMRAAIETLNVIEADGLMKNAEVVGEHLRGALRRELGGLAGVVDVRGEGLMIGVELARPCGAILTRAAEAGLLFSVTADTVIRIVPPLIFTVADADEVVAKLAPLVKAFLAEQA